MSSPVYPETSTISRDISAPLILSPAPFSGSGTQRLLLRSRSHRWKEPADDSVRSGELDNRHRQGRPSHPESSEGACTRWPPDRSRRRRSDQLSRSEFRSENWIVHSRRSSKLEYLLRQAF